MREWMGEWSVVAGCCWRGNFGLEREAGGRERGAGAGGWGWRGVERGWKGRPKLESEGGAGEVSWG